jgi:hypothetical protein
MGRDVFRNDGESTGILKPALLRRLCPDRDGRSCARRKRGAERLLSTDNSVGNGRALRRASGSSLTLGARA